MSSAGAESAYRGYRLQALYILSRVLRPGDSQRLTFQPEGHEDLAVFEESGELIEVAQVKAYGESLMLSDFSPEKPDSFFHRVVELSRKHPQATVKIVSFGSMGPEMVHAWETDGHERHAVARKLLDRGFLSSDVDTIFNLVQLVEADERRLRDEVFAFLRRSLVGGDPEHAFDLLTYWLYLASENRDKLTYSSLIEKINSVGRYLVERAVHHQEWFTSIFPIEDRYLSEDEQGPLAEEFYQGVGARYEHILANVDVVRDEKLREIEAAFRETRVVIIHGASGQGKSTLAYRYLHDFVPNQWRFVVRTIEDRQDALRIAAALVGHANAVNVPMVIYVDVSHHDRDWADLIRELAQHRNLRLLVTVREEDWRRASISGAEFQFKSLELAFDETEGRELYPRLVSRKAPDRFLTFEDAWRRFGLGGPLLEFVYLVTQNESLRERLQQQIQYLQDAVRIGQLRHNELDLLRLVSVASAYEARVDLKMLVERLELLEPKRTIQLFEREYLLRCSPDGRYIEGLHPIRSAILTDLLTDPVLATWTEAASACLSMIAEDDLEAFLLHAFSRRGDDAPKLLETLSFYQPETWTGFAGVLRGLLWFGVREYITANQELIRDAFGLFGPAWSVVLDFDIAGVSSESSSWWKDWNFVPEQRRKEIENFREQQTSKEAVFTRTRRWLTGRHQAPSSPATLSDWDGMAEACFWVGYLHVNSPIMPHITEPDLDKAVDTLPLHYLGDVILGLSSAWGDRFYVWLNQNRTRILNHFREETQTVAVEDDGETIRAHFIVDLESFTDDGANGQIASATHHNRPHDEALRRVELLRKLLPDRQNYGCQGYGHKLGALELPFDDTEKTGIPLKRLPPHWPVRVNSVFIQLGVYHFRSQTWHEYAQAVNHFREMVLSSLQELQRALVVHFRKQKPVELLGSYINTAKWTQCYLAAGSPPLLPQCAVDEWGFTGEDMANQISPEAVSQILQRTAAVLALWQYKAYLSALRDFTSSLWKFYSQSMHVLALNAVLGKARSAEDKTTVRQTALAQGIRTDLDHLSAYNFAEAFKALSSFQEEFRRHFSQFFDEGSLDRLERREGDIFTQAWSLWYQFAFHPGQIWSNADQEALGKLKSTLVEVRRDIRRHFLKLSGEGIQATILSENIRWEDQPALWIAFDVANPLNLHAAFESVINALMTAMRTVESNELRRYALDFWWRTTVIVPLVKGKSLAKVAWKIATPVFLSGSVFRGDDWWNYVLHPVAPKDWEKLGLPVWEHPRLELVNQLQNAVVTLSLLAAHICDLNRLPEPDEQGRRLLQNYVVAQSGRISEAFQQVLDRMGELANYFNGLSREEQQRPALLATMKLLVETHESVMPGEDFHGEIKMDLESIKEWLRRLETARVQAELLRLYWTADTLGLLTP